MIASTHFAVKVRATIDAEAINGALRRLSDKHDLLRTRVDESTGTPCLIYTQGYLDDVMDVDLTPQISALHDEPDQIEHLIQEAVGSFIWHHFDFDSRAARSGPLLRAAAFRTAADAGIIVVVFHHSISDANSVAAAKSEFLTLLLAQTEPAAAGEGRPDILEAAEDAAPPLESLQYHDHVLSMQEWLDTPAGNLALDHWKAKAHTDAPFMPATDFAVGEVNGPELAGVRYMIAGDDLGRIRTFCKENGVTLPALLMFAKAAVISKHSGNPSPFIRVVHHGRDSALFMGQMGAYITYLPFRFSIDQEASFLENLTSMNASWVKFICSTPIYLPEMHSPDGAAVLCPSFNYIDMSTPEVSWGQSQRRCADVEEYLVRPRTMKSGHQSCGFMIWNRPSYILGYMAYAPNLYSRSTIDHILTGFQALIAAAIEDPGAALAALLRQL